MEFCGNLYACINQNAKYSKVAVSYSKKIAYAQRIVFSPCCMHVCEKKENLIGNDNI